MTLRNRLTLLATLVFGIVFTIASTVVYFAFKQSSTRLIYNELEQTSFLTAYFYLEEDELPQKEHLEIKRQFQANIHNAEVRIYDEDNQIKYGLDQEDNAISSSILDQVRKDKRINFKDGSHFYSGIFYPDNQGNFVVFIKESNQFFRDQINRLLLIMGIVLLLGLAAIFLSSKLLSRLAYKPVTDVINQVNSINPESMDRPIQSPGTNDELQELIETFNDLLERLSETFIVQKNFINYVSHEFKTPLTAISGNLEVFGQKERSQEEYRQVAKDALANIYQIEEILNTLLIVSGIKKKNDLEQQIRIDEIIWEIIERLGVHFPQQNLPQVNMHIRAEDELLLKINAGKSQLQLALYNIVENAIKYADGSIVSIDFFKKDGELILQVSDKGRGIPERDLSYITKPFYRGSNAHRVKGSGIGLSLASIICKQNNIQLEINSSEGKGTAISLRFPRL